MDGVSVLVVDPDTSEALVVAAEVRRSEAALAPRELVRAIHTQYYIDPLTIDFVPLGSISKTASGKISRSRARDRSQYIAELCNRTSRGGSASPRAGSTRSPRSGCWTTSRS
jgi:acyl-CoA synthetase (AMP-forming)/AMP-acid ligase II